MKHMRVFINGFPTSYTSLQIAGLLHENLKQYEFTVSFPKSTKGFCYVSIQWSPDVDITKLFEEISKITVDNVKLKAELYSYKIHADNIKDYEFVWKIKKLLEFLEIKDFEFSPDIELPIKKFKHSALLTTTDKDSYVRLLKMKRLVFNNLFLCSLSKRR